MINKVLLALLIVPAFIALARPGYFPMHDDIQGMRLLQMHKCVLDFQLPCRWVPDMGYGYGYPQFIFYSPLPYYLMVTLVVLGAGILESVKIGFGISLIASAYSMYLLGSYLWGKKGGIVSALFYTYAPYRAVDIYVRGAMGEAWAFVFLPLIILFTARGKILPLALSVAGLLVTHNVSTIMFLPFWGAATFFLIRPRLREYARIVAGAFWGGALAAFFVLPAFLEKNHTHVETVLSGYFNYLAHFVGIKQLLFSTFWGYGVSALGELDGMSVSVGILNWSIPLLVVGLLLYLGKIKTFKTAAVFLFLGLIALFLVHPKSQFVWDSLGIMSYIQFPWRFLGVSIFLFSVATGALAKLITRRRSAMVVFVFLILLLVNGSFFKPQEYIDIADSVKFSGENWDKQQTISIMDYLPVSALYPPVARAPELPQILEADGRVLGGEKGTNWQKWEVVLKESGKVRLQQFDFPGWRVKVDGEARQIYSDNELGLITVDVSEGTHSVHAKLYDTNIRLIGNLVSLFALIAIPVYRRRAR